MIKLLVGGYELLPCPFCGGTPNINLDARFKGGGCVCIMRKMPFEGNNLLDAR